uniref:Uncharacterized protein n=1 Tax=Haptolina brevifila TaxID=156173 RepID=A0A7S2IT75_9EUKA
MLAPGAGSLLAVIAGERLGSSIGRICLPVFVGVGAVSAAAALGGDARGERVAGTLQRAALLLLPALHGCLPVYTMSAPSALGLVWFMLAAAAPTFEETRVGQHLGCAVGAASMLRVLRTRVPICHF